MPDHVPAESVAGSDANIARHLGRMAGLRSDAVALKVARGRTRGGEIDYLALSFAELDAEVSAWTDRLHGGGVRRGDRTLVMVRQGLPLIASVFAIFRMGAVPVIIDPGMGLRSFLACVARSRPRALVGIPFAQVVSRVFRPAFRSIETRIAASGGLTARLRPSQKSLSAGVPPLPSAAADLAAVLFTSGSTGAPKGVCYEHGMFDAQVRVIRDTYGIEPGEIDLPLLPIFALFNPALGMTTIVPEIDPRRPAALEPAKIVQAIRQEKVTNSFGSPTLWGKIAGHCRAAHLTLPSLRRVLCAGAPVPARLWEDAQVILPHGRLQSPYGATEALPVATVSAEEIEVASVRGACVGRPVRETSVRIIGVSDAPIATLADASQTRPGEIGEIIVHGPVVTKTYDGLAEATRLAKIHEGGRSGLGVGRTYQQFPDDGGSRDGRTDAVAPAISTGAPVVGSAAPVWHRMGDCGFLGADGRLWFCGRKAERVVTAAGTLHTEPCEQVYRLHPRVGRCALIGLGARGSQRPAIVVEARLSNPDEGYAFAFELRALGAEYPHTSDIHLFFFRPTFPVDVRHNAKIHRLTLAQWAATAKGFDFAANPPAQG